MGDLLAARSQMAVSLGFHIVFAAVGIGLPVLVLVAEVAWMRTRAPVWRDLARAWSKGLAIFFAVGAVSGTVLSFELGLLWPRFMAYAGPLVGMPFSLEGFAFFTEAIFLGIYLYGWGRVGPRAHLAAAAVVAVSGSTSALFVLSVNGWMNAPTGFRPGPAGALAVDPLAAMANPFWLANTGHMLLAALAATGFGAASIHAWKLLGEGGSAFHRRALTVSLVVGGAGALLQPLSGDVTARVVARHQPAKLAAMESHFVTGPCAPLHIGGWPDEAAGTTRWSLDVPCGLSLMLAGDPHAVVQGMDAVPPGERPPVAPVHAAFQVMVAVGVFLALLAAWSGIGALRHRPPWTRPLLLRLLVVAGPLAFLAIEAGWTVTEVGRQPWIIYGVMRTKDAVTPMPGLVVPFAGFTLLYLFLAGVVVLLLGHLTSTEGSGAGVEGTP